MMTYAVGAGDSLMFSVDGGRWELVEFGPADLASPGAATAAELAAAVNRSGALAAYADERERLVLATARGGGDVTLEIDLAGSSAAPALGLTGAAGAVHGAGPAPARLRSPATEPFPIPAGGELFLVVDGGARRRVTFSERAVTAGRATAEQVCAAINSVRRVATPTRDGRVMLLSPTVGPKSSLEVGPGRSGQPDAASALGFAGAAAVSRPDPSLPAELPCTGRPAGLRAVNLTAGPVELHLPGGALVLPPGGTVTLTGTDAAAPALRRLSGAGVIGLRTAETEGTS